MQEEHPERDSTHAQDGNAAHWAARVVLLDWVRGKPSSLSFIGPNVKADNGVLLTAEMVDAANVYAKDVIKEAILRGLVSELHIEERVHASRIHPESWGTVDAFLYDPARRELIVWDFKFGWGVVEPFENWQLINYVAGIVGLLGLPEEITVKMRVAQPRPYHNGGRIREWSLKLIDLRGLFNILSHSAHVALQDNPPTKSGSHCANCSARHACPADQKAGMAYVEYSETARTVQLPPGALGAEIGILRRVCKTMGGRLTALETEAISLIKGGKTVDGWAAEPGQGKTVWTRPVAEVVQLGRDKGIELAKPQALITPIQAGNDGMGKEDLEGYIEHKSGSLKLIKAADTIAAKAFKK